jgi:hypothetical protein
MFYFVSNIFSLISNKVLISLYTCLDSNHINYFTATRAVLNFLYKETADRIIFIIHMLKLSIIYVDVYFHNITKNLKILSYILS